MTDLLKEALVPDRFVFQSNLQAIVHGGAGGKKSKFKKTAGSDEDFL